MGYEHLDLAEAFVQIDWQQFIHTLMVVAAVQVPDQNIRSSSGFSLTCRPVETNQRPSDNKTLDLPSSHSRPRSTDIGKTKIIFSVNAMSTSTSSCSPVFKHLDK